MTSIILGVFALVIAAAYTVGISQIPLLGFGDPLGPKLLPAILAGALVVVGLVLLAEGRVSAGVLGKDFLRLRTFARSREFRAVAGVTVWIALYFAAFHPLGYILSTAAFLSGLMVTFHTGRRSVALVVAISFSIGSYLLFALLFSVPLPRGILPL